MLGEGDGFGSSGGAKMGLIPRICDHLFAFIDYQQVGVFTTHGRGE